MNTKKLGANKMVEGVWGGLPGSAGCGFLQGKSEEPDRKQVTGWVGRVSFRLPLPDPVEAITVLSQGREARTGAHQGGDCHSEGVSRALPGGPVRRAPTLPS